MEQQSIAAFLVLLPLLTGLAQGATVSALSPSRSDVAAAIAAASNGDTITIPAGTATWTNTLVCAKWLSFAGAGIDQTIIVAAVPNPGGQQAVAALRLEGNGYQQVSGITFDGSHMVAWPALSISTGPSVRVHHCKFVNCRTGVFVGGSFGVIDHNTFLNCDHISQVYGWGAGNGNWATYYPIPYSSTNYLFFEDNTITVNSSASFPTERQCFVSSGQGSSYVVRHNTFTYGKDGFGLSPCFDWHGDNNDGTAGSLSVQIYANTFTFTGTSHMDIFCAARGGQSLIYSNTVTSTPGYGGYGNGIYEEHPEGTIVAGQRVYQPVTNMWTWASTINGALMINTCMSAGGCAMCDYHAAPYPGGSFTQPYPHPLVTGVPPPPVLVPGTIRIIYPSMSISEVDISLTVTFVREGGADGAVSAHYATADGTAIAGTHYTDTHGDISWADGDSANKTVEVPVANLGATGTRQFTLSISSPTGGATLGVPSTTTVTITGSGTYYPPPTITSVSAAAADGWYKAGAAIPIIVHGSDNLVVSGTPTLALNSGGTATYQSGSGSPNLTFAYTVLPGHSSTNLAYTATNALTATGGWIRSAAGQPANLALPALGSTNSLGQGRSRMIDTAPPVVTIGRAQRYVGTISPVWFELTYSDSSPVSVGLTTNHVVLTSTVGGTVTVSATPGSLTQRVYIDGYSGSGQFSISVRAGSAGDAAGNLAGAAGPSETVVLGTKAKIRVVRAGKATSQ